MECEPAGGPHASSISQGKTFEFITVFEPNAMALDFCFCAFSHSQNMPGV
jgi:hypothetical protein